jgi:hypothetical protein
LPAASYAWTATVWAPFVAVAVFQFHRNGVIVRVPTGAAPWYAT